MHKINELEDFDFQIQTPAAHPGPQAERALYGFVMYISSFLMFALYLIFAFVPRDWLALIGITYLPHRHWAVTFPLTLVVIGVGFLVGYTLCHFPLIQPLTSIYQIRDPQSPRRGQHSFSNGSSIPPHSDYPPSLVTRELYLHPAQRCIVAPCDS